MNSTAAVLRRIKVMCKKEDGCSNCVLKRLFCDIVPDHWTDAEMEEIADMIDDYEEEEK